MNEIDRYKGDRNYIHATDELLYAEPLIQDAEMFTFTARQVGTCVARWFDSSEAAVDGWEAIARLIVHTPEGGRKTYECRQDLSRPITTSVAFDEDTLMEPAVLEGERLKFNLTGSFTLWEYLSTLQKLLLQKVIGHQQWYFVRLKLEAKAFANMNSKSLKMWLRYSQQKGPLYISEIAVNDDVVGEIAYSKR